MNVNNPISKRRFPTALFGLAIVFLLSVGFAGLRAYHVSCLAADAYVAGAPDGPWVRAKSRLVLDFEPDASPIAAAPHWIFRFRNPRNGNESKRIYVTFFGDRAFSYSLVLDPAPLLGEWP
jgi:hypothetical protein